MSNRTEIEIWVARDIDGTWLFFGDEPRQDSGEWIGVESDLRLDDFHMSWDVIPGQCRKYTIKAVGSGNADHIGLKDLADYEWTRAEDGLPRKIARAWWHRDEEYTDEVTPLELDYINTLTDEIAEAWRDLMTRLNTDLERDTPKWTSLKQLDAYDWDADTPGRIARAWAEEGDAPFELWEWDLDELHENAADEIAAAWESHLDRQSEIGHGL